jgi:hypothetical protein
MNNIDYKSIIPYKVMDVVYYLMTKNNFGFREALGYLYDSKLYSFLSKEETKLWHLSAYKLFDILIEEKESGNFILPDFV